ncbi:MAG: glutamyl-tRNA reductase [Opitutales bacterium]
MSAPDAQTPGFFVVGANHHQTPIEVREKLSLGADGFEALQLALTGIAGLREFAVLNTCNRIEFYGVADNAAAADGVQQTFCRRQDFPEPEFTKYRLHLQGLDAVQHLLEVASGLDSQLVGETEIFGQVKAAYAKAQSRHSTGPVLNRIFQKAFQSAKHVRTNTAITSGHVSVANVAVDLAQTIFGQLGSTRILLLGAGEIGEKTAKAFRSREAGSITVSSRRLERAMELAATLDGTALPFEHRESHLADFDVVVCCTSAPTAVLTRDAVAAAMKKRAARPLFLIDLALPRDIEAGVADLANAYLYNLDDLAKIADENRAARETEIDKCRRILGERAAALWQQVGPRLNPAATSPAAASGSDAPKTSEA